MRCLFDRRQASAHLIVQVGVGKDQELVGLDTGKHAERQITSRHRLAQRLIKAGADAREYGRRSF